MERAGGSKGLIGSAMLISALAGFLVPLVVGHWSDRAHDQRRGRRPFMVGGAVIATLGLAALCLGSLLPFVMLTLFGAVAYLGIDTVRTAHRALVHDNFERDGHTRGTGAQEAAQLGGALLGLALGGGLVGLADWAPFLLGGVVTPILCWVTIRRVAVREVRKTQHVGLPLSFYLTASFRPGVRAILAAEVLWVLGYAALPVFFIIYAKNELGMGPGIASLWLAIFAVLSGIVMLLSGRVTRPGRHKGLLALGVLLMGLGFLGVAFSHALLWVSMTLILSAVGFGLISTLGFALFASLIPRGEAGGYTALYFSVRAIASAVALPIVGWTIEITDSYRALFWFAGVATLVALLPLAFAPRADGRRPWGARLKLVD